MTDAIERHDTLLLEVQDILKRLFKELLPECKGWVLFSLSKLEEDPGPRTAVITNFLEKHSVKLLTEIMRQHIYENEMPVDENISAEELWVRFQTTFKKD